MYINESENIGMRLFDTHCHIGLIHSDYLEQLLAVSYAKRAGVRHIISITNSITDWEKNYRNIRSARNVYHAVGVSPTESGNRLDDWESKVKQYITYERVVAVGETGLDYVKDFGSRNTQISLFIKQLDIARSADKPVIIHNRGAANDILEILKTRIPDKGAVFHCYSEDWSFASKAMNLNVWFSFAGNVTYRNIANLAETIKKLPADRILIESEAPFMVPARYTKKRNKPQYLEETLKAVAAIRGEDPVSLSEQIYSNSLKAFSVPDADL